MNGAVNRDWAVQLPNQMPTIGQALQSVAAKQERDRERQDEQMRRQQAEQQRLREQQQQMEWRNLGMLKDEVNLDKIATGEATIDDFFKTKAEETLRYFTSNPEIMRMPPTTLYGMIQDKWLPIAIGSATAKKRLSQVDAAVKQAAKVDDNLDIQSLTQDARRGVVNQLVKRNEAGEIEFRKPSDPEFNVEKDIVGELLNSKDSWKYIASPKPFLELLEEKGQPVELYKETEGGKVTIPYKGTLSRFQQLNVTPKEGGLIGEKDVPQGVLKTEKIESVKRNGKPMEVLDEEIFRSNIEADPRIRRGFDYLWNRHKAQFGLDPKSNQEEDLLKREFAADYLRQNLRNQIIPTKPDKSIQKMYESNRLSTERMLKGIAARSAKDEQVSIGHMLSNIGSGKEIPLINNEKVSGYLSNGKLLDSNKRPVKKVTRILPKYLPTDMITVLKNSKVDIDKIIQDEELIDLESDANGNIIRMTNPTMGTITAPTKVSSGSTQKVVAGSGQQQNVKPAGGRKYVGLDKNGNPIFQ